MPHLTDSQSQQEAVDTMLRSLIVFKANVYARLDDIEAKVSEILCSISGDKAEW
jgi:hypothetical protein